MNAKEADINSNFQLPTSDFRHPVLFVGAGPGDPELITVKGRHALEAADLVVYAGSLVPEELLSWTRPGTPAINSASLPLEEIVFAMVQAHRSGKRVVRLHTGDPSLYGAVFEQIAELDKLGIPFRIIPGVTAAFAAAAALGIEYTLPEVAQTLILTRAAGRTPVPARENLACLAAHRASMVIYLSMGRIEEVAAILAGEYGEHAACAVVYQASQPGEKVIRTRLKDLVEKVRAAGITRQALVIVGRVLEVGPQDLKVKSKLYDKDFEHGFRK
jgi:precorrin-4/cobalt-precorrin-4 C11-methyltransferase